MAVVRHVMNPKLGSAPAAAGIPNPVFARFAFVLVAQAEIDGCDSRRRFLEDEEAQALHLEVTRANQDLDAMGATNEQWRAMQRWLKGGAS